MSLYRAYNSGYGGIEISYGVFVPNNTRGDIMTFLAREFFWEIEHPIFSEDVLSPYLKSIFWRGIPRYDKILKIGG